MNKNINMSINPEDLTDVSCSSCGNEFFTPSFLLKKVSALQSPTGEKMMLPMQVFRCDSCGEVLNPGN